MRVQEPVMKAVKKIRAIINAEEKEGAEEMPGPLSAFPGICPDLRARCVCLMEAAPDAFP
jgi:hypothetical protein